MKIIYKGEPNTLLDQTLEAILKVFRYEFEGSGYNFKTNERDLGFKYKNRTPEEGGKIEEPVKK